MRRQKGGSQAVSHINNSLGRSQIGLKAKGEGRGAGGATTHGHLIREAVSVFLSLHSLTFTYTNTHPHF